MTVLLIVDASVLVAAILIWRISAGRRGRRGLDSVLASQDPATRAGALALVTAGGVDRFAPTLWHMATTETDRTVLDTLTWVIDRTRATPAQSPELMALRLWAAKRSASGTGGSWAGLAGAAELPSGEPEDRFSGSVDAEWGFSGIDGGGWSGPAGSPAGGRVVRSSMSGWGGRGAWGGPVVVTGAGGVAGVAVIRALHRVGRAVLAVDADEAAVGFRLAEDFSLVPRGDDPALVDRLAKLAIRSGAVALIPTVAAELVVLHAGAAQLAEAGLATWLPEPSSVQNCLDRWLFSQLMTANGIAVPATRPGSEFGVRGPWLVKGRFGHSGVYQADDAVGLAYAFDRVADPMVQTRVEGREFLVDTLCDEQGHLLGAIPRWRGPTRAGSSPQELTFDDPHLVGAVAEVLSVLALAGPSCVKGIVTATGPVFLEVHPCFSAGLPLSLTAGADLVGQYLRRVTGGVVQPQHLDYRPGVAMLRYYGEVFEE